MQGNTLIQTCLRRDMRHQIYPMIMESTALVYLRIFVGPQLLCVLVCVYPCVYMKVQGEVRGQCWLTPSIPFHFIL